MCDFFGGQGTRTPKSPRLLPRLLVALRKLAKVPLLKTTLRQLNWMWRSVALTPTDQHPSTGRFSACYQRRTGNSSPATNLLICENDLLTRCAGAIEAWSLWESPTDTWFELRPLCEMELMPRVAWVAKNLRLARENNYYSSDKGT